MDAIARWTTIHEWATTKNMRIVFSRYVGNGEYWLTDHKDNVYHVLVASRKVQELP